MCNTRTLYLQMATPTDFHGKLALVTGATGGIGKATCRKLAELGCDIAVHYNSAADMAQELAQELESKGVKSKSVSLPFLRHDVGSLRVLGKAESHVLPYLSLFFYSALY